LAFLTIGRSCGIRTSRAGHLHVVSSLSAETATPPPSLWPPCSPPSPASTANPLRRQWS
jgi:hypothetical protein